MNRLTIFLLASVLIFSSCKQNEEQKIDIESIVNESIKESGGDKTEGSTISFDFRDKHYKATRNKGIFQIERHFKDSINSIKDILSNSGFKRFVNDELIVIPDSMATRYSNSVNSVHYFSVLPFGLNDDAVNKTYLGLINIKGKKYHKIKVTFNEEGGGDDFDDVFIYWINTINNKVDYLAYSYHTNEGGMRFREAYNERFVNGIRFVDYNNYKPKNKDVLLIDIDKLFEKEQLDLLSKIELKNVEVDLLN